VSAKGDPLETIKNDGAVGDFPRRHRGRDGDEARRAQEQCRPQAYDTILKFKIVVLQSLYNLFDEQTNS